MRRRACLFMALSDVTGAVGVLCQLTGVTLLQSLFGVANEKS